jgi:HSP20 family protein
MFGLMRRKKRPQTPAEPRGLTPFDYLDFPFFLGRMREEFDRLLDAFAGKGEGWRWDVEVKDEPEAIVVVAEAPGFEPGDFDVQVQDGYLVLRASHKEEKEEKEKKYQEDRARECYESFALPAGIDKDKVEARYEKGILTITLPKTAEGKPRRVTVQPG